MLAMAQAVPEEEPRPGTLQEFVARYPCDSRAQDYLSASAPGVAERALREFRPPREGEADYSALLVTFVRSLRHADLASRLGAGDEGDPGGGPRGPGVSTAELQAEVERFKQQFPLDESAYNYLVNSPPEVQWVVLQDFNPPRQGESDYSALLISFTKRCRQGVLQQQFQQQQHLFAASPPPPAGPSPHAFSAGRPQHQLSHMAAGAAPALVDDALGAEVQLFCNRYPMDEMAYNYLLHSTPDVQAQVLREFRPPREGEGDYSALVISFSKRCRTAAGAALLNGSSLPLGHGGGVLGTAEYEAFQQRFPFDEMAHNYLANSAPEVQFEVLRTFKPPKEGEGDYSALLITYTKRCRQGAMQRAAAEAARLQPYRPPLAYPGAYRGPANGGFVRPPPPVYPMQRPPPPQYPRPQTFPSRGAWAPAAPPVAWAASGATSGSAEIEAFRQRFPMDERAFSYLTESSPEVQRQVVETFVPKRLEDSDFSAPVVAYAKLCRARCGGSSATYGVPHGRNDASGGAALVAQIGDFCRRYPVDSRALELLLSAPPAVTARVLHEFRARREGEADYSAAVVAFVGVCKRGLFPGADLGPGPPKRPRAF